MQAIVLAAGFGTRLWPLTADRAKPAVPFLGTPLVRQMVDLLNAHGIDRVVVNTHYQPASIRDALVGLPVAFSHETEIVGTAGALALARDRGLLNPDEPVLIANGKLSTDLDVGRLITTHESSGAAVTMALRSNPSREHFREVLVENDLVVGFGRGRIPEGENPLSFTGIHIVGPQVLAAMTATFSDTVQDIYPAFIAEGGVRACLLDEGRWWELSTLARYHALHVEAHRLGIGPDVVCSPGAIVEEGATVRRSVLWPGARIAAGAVVEDAVLGAGVEVVAGEHRANVVLVDREILTEDPPQAGRPDGARWAVELSPT